MEWEWGGDRIFVGWEEVRCFGWNEIIFDFFWTMWGEWPQVSLKRASEAIVNSSRTVVFQRFQQSVMLVCWLTMAMIWLYCQLWPKGEVEVLMVWNVRAIPIAISWTTSRRTKFGSKTRTFLSPKPTTNETNLVAEHSIQSTSYHQTWPKMI